VKLLLWLNSCVNISVDVVMEVVYGMIIDMWKNVCICIE